jgi:hypothetical protein
MGNSQRLIRLRFRGQCSACNGELPEGTEAYWDREAHATMCTACQGSDAPPESGVLLPGVAGVSARLKAERERAQGQVQRDQELELRRRQGAATIERRAVLGRVMVGVRSRVDPPKPPTVESGPWEKGALAEESLGARMADLAARGFAVLHDRRKPGTQFNLDHLVVAPDGVWVVDSKHYKGQLEHRAAGTFLRPASHLYVGGHRRTELVENMGWQVTTVAQALDDLLDGPPVKLHPVLCFVGVTMPVWQRPFRIGDVLVTWPTALMRTLVKSTGPLTIAERQAIAGRLATALPPGS